MNEKFAGYFNNIKKRAGAAAETVKEKTASTVTAIRGKTQGAAEVMKQKAQQTAAVARVNADLYTQKGKIKNLETELGRLYYEAVSAGKQPDEDAMNELFSRLDEANRQLAEDKAFLEGERAELRGEASVDDDEITDDDFVIPGRTEEE